MAFLRFSERQNLSDSPGRQAGRQEGRGEAGRRGDPAGTRQEETPAGPPPATCCPLPCVLGQGQLPRVHPPPPAAQARIRGWSQRAGCEQLQGRSQHWALTPPTPRTQVGRTQPRDSEPWEEAKGLGARGPQGGSPSRSQQARLPSPMPPREDLCFTRELGSRGGPGDAAALRDAPKGRGRGRGQSPPWTQRTWERQGPTGPVASSSGELGVRGVKAPGPTVALSLGRGRLRRHLRGMTRKGPCTRISIT